ncbi:hypothetical protein QFC21_006868 [Naganishia friedmannii]|uniref:Uncharacterized protein n=1 Tax=Naganishia friedmannii TaxID=89922 RepID=A0ACC2V0Z0_9TREE|nr:hypothetical protein QFC21_006868 [Naganishia friedmannii]
MDHPHPLSLALFSHIPVSPAFIYLHHPFHSSAYALPRSLTHGRSEDGKEQRDEVEQDVIRRVVVVVDVAALGDNATNTFSQKAFYNAVLRQLFASITTKLPLLEQHASSHNNGKTMPAEIGIVHPSPKQTRKKGPATTTAAAAITAFHARFTLITQKDVYRWDVFLLRLAAMMHAFSAVFSTLPQDEPCVGTRETASLTLIETFDTTLVLCSTRAWDDVRPMTGDAAEPYHLFLRAPNKNETLSALRKHNSHPLFPYFLDLLYTASCHLVPLDLIPESEKLAKVLWVVYMLPLDGFRHRESSAIHLWDGQLLADAPAADVAPADSSEPLRITYQLLTDLKNQSSYAFAAANESLIPHRCAGGAARFLDVFTGERKRRRREMEEEFARALHGREGEGGGGGAWFALANQVRQEQPPAARQTTVDPIITHLSGLSTTKPAPPPPRIPKPPIPRLPLYAKYLVLAAYCASYNSPRTDLRMFGRGPLTLRGKTRRSSGAGRGYEGSGSAGKKVGAGLKKLKTTTTTLGKAGARVPQALLGPKSFPLERMLAVFQSLLAEHGFRAEAYHSDEFSDSGSEGEGEGMSSGPSEDGGGGRVDDMRTEGKNGPPGSPSRRGSRKRKATTAGNDGGGVLDFRVVDEQAERIERKRRRENEMLRSWEEEVEEISRSVGLFALIRELEGLRLLNRISPRDRLDNILLRCEAPKEMVLEFARQVKVDLASYLVEGD